MSDEAAERLGDLLEAIADSLDVDVEVWIDEEDGQITGRFEGDGVGQLIGRRGQTIDAIQHLAQRIVFKETPAAARIVVDADGYRERRAAALRDEADEVAGEVLASGEPVVMEPMSAAERRVVHEHLRERGDVRTYSEGEEPARFLVVSPAS